jgi:hypothetical protein
VFSFVAKKEKTAFFDGRYEGCGDAYAFTAIDRDSKLLLTAGGLNVLPSTRT